MPKLFAGRAALHFFQVFAGRIKTTCILLFWKLISYDTIINITRNNSRISFITQQKLFFLNAPSHFARNMQLLLFANKFVAS